MKKKYELTDETMKYAGHVLHRIKALVSFADVKEGDLGGWIENESNLSHLGNAWVYGDARVYGNAVVSDDAKVYGHAVVSGCAEVYGHAVVSGNAVVSGCAVVSDNAEVYGGARVSGCARVFGTAEVSDDAVVSGNAEISGCARVSSINDYITFKNFWSSGRFFTWTRSNNKWKVGCFYGLGDELISKAYEDSQKSGREYERVVKYVERILHDEKLRMNNK